MASLVSQNVLHYDLSDRGTTHCAEAECLALCVLSNQHFSQGEYEMAEHILNIAKENFRKPYTYSEIWSKVEQCQLCDRAYFHRDVAAMKLACDNLMALDQKEATLRRARMFTVQRHYLKAVKLLSDLLSCDELTSQTFAGIELKVRILLELIQTYCEMRDTANAAKHIADCIELTSNKHLVHQNALCYYYAAHVQLVSGKVEVAYDIITEHLPTLLVTGTCYDKGRAQLLYSKAKIAASKVKQKENYQHRKVITEVLEILRLALSNLEQVEAFFLLQETLLYLALLCNIDGDEESRNNYSFQYKQNQSKCCCDSSFEPDTVML